jgi:prepilin-type N-terminal cleavage/methylation domain-containing protein
MKHGTTGNFTHLGGAMLRNRKGVTLIEIMTVVCLAAVVMAITFPSMKDTRRAASMQSARAQVESYLAVARSVAIRNGSGAMLIRDGNTIRIEAKVNGAMTTVVPAVKLDESSNSLLSTEGGAAKDTIFYDSRGMATNLTGTRKFYVTAASGSGAGTKDSICVTRLGMLLDRNCGLAATAEKAEEKTEDPDVIILDPDILIEPIEPIISPIIK